MNQGKELDEAIQRSKDALERLAALEKLIGENTKHVNQILKWLRGNGERGLMVRVEDLEKFVGEYISERKEQKKDDKKTRLVIYAAILSMLLNIAYQIFYKGVESSINSTTIQQLEKREQQINEKFEKLLKKLDEKQ